MESTAARDDTPVRSASGGGASRTFQSLFGATAQEQLTPTPTADHHNDAPQPTNDKRIAKPQEEEDGDVWDDDFPSDANMESAEEDEEGGGDSGGKPQPKAAAARAMLTQTISLQSRLSIDEWADNDDDEDTWKDALQARVDQLELVVDKKAELQPALVQLDSRSLTPVKCLTGGYAAPVDQRATLTLVPKTNLVRSISAPPAAEGHKPSKLKAPHVVRSTTTSTTNAALAPKAKSGFTGSDQTPARKRSNSRDFLTRQTLATDHKRLTKSIGTTNLPNTTNSVFVRAVVARGNNTGHNRDAQTADEAHVDKRAKPDDRMVVMALSEAEVVRRHILNDVKKISVERIVTDAKRLHFLEDYYRRHPDTSELKRHPNVDAGIGGVRQSSSTKKRAA